MAKQQAEKAIQLGKSSFNFLNQLKKNNDRTWFAEHKEEYQRELAGVEIFADTLLQYLNAHDTIETLTGKKSLYRIYRDTRFSTDKIPYKTHWSGSFRRAGKSRRGGYYFHLEPGKSFIAGGFFGPSPADLKLIREDIAFDATPLRTILNSKVFIDAFGALKGDQVKTAPKGFSIGDEAIDLLRYKQFLLVKHFSDDEVLSPDFAKLASEGFKNMRPFLDYMSEVLVMDVNGA